LEGADLLMVDRDRAKLCDAASSLSKLHDGALVYKDGDVSCKEFATSLFMDTVVNLLFMLFVNAK